MQEVVVPKKSNNKGLATNCKPGAEGTKKITRNHITLLLQGTVKSPPPLSSPLLPDASRPATIAADVSSTGREARSASQPADSAVIAYRQANLPLRLRLIRGDSRRLRRRECAVLTTSSTLTRRYAPEQGTRPDTAHRSTRLRLLDRRTAPVSTAHCGEKMTRWT